MILCLILLPFSNNYVQVVEPVARDSLKLDHYRKQMLIVNLMNNSYIWSTSLTYNNCLSNVQVDIWGVLDYSTIADSLMSCLHVLFRR